MKWRAAEMSKHSILGAGDFVLVKPTVCSDLEALPKRLLPIHPLLVFAQRGYLFPLSIYTLKVFSFNALAGAHREDSKAVNPCLLANEVYH